MIEQIETINVKDLERAYKSLILADYLRPLNYDTIRAYEVMLMANDILGIRVPILDTIRNEKRKRLMENYLLYRCENEEDFVTKNVVSKMSMEELELSTDYLRNYEIPAEDIFKKCPLFLSIEKTSKLYGFLREVGYDDEQIVKLLTDDNKLQFATCVLQDPELPQRKSMLNEHSFKEFIKRVYERIKDNNQK